MDVLVDTRGASGDAFGRQHYHHDYSGSGSSIGERRRDSPGLTSLQQSGSTAPASASTSMFVVQQGGAATAAAGRDGTAGTSTAGGIVFSEEDDPRTPTRPKRQASRDDAAAASSAVASSSFSAEIDDGSPVQHSNGSSIPYAALSLDLSASSLEPGDSVSAPSSDRELEEAAPPDAHPLARRLTREQSQSQRQRQAQPDDGAEGEGDDGAQHALRPARSEEGHADAADISAASSPDPDSDNRPLNKAVTVALQRGDSTSSDSSVSGLSRASSSSSVYATPFRMTPFRTPAGGNSRAGSTSGEGRTSYFPTLLPPRFGGNGTRGYTTARNSFSNPVPRGGLPVAPGVHVVPSAAAEPKLLPVIVDEASLRSSPSNSGLSGHRASSSNATIGPSAAALYAAEATAAAAAANGSFHANTLGSGRTPRPAIIALPSSGSIFASNGGPAETAPQQPPQGFPLLQQQNGGSSHAMLRPPTTPGAELMLAAGPPGSVPPNGMLRPLSSVRPGLGSRTTSNASIGNNFHKKASDFDLGEILGEGSYSTVFLATDKFPPHRQYALKVLDKKHIIKERKVKYVNVEKETLARLDRHPGIIRLYWTFHDERSLYFVLELASNGEILKFIKDYGSFEVNVARFYAAQVISAVEHMHKRGVVHRDLKPENMLLDEKMRVKLADFGTAKLLNPNGSVENVSAEDHLQSRSNSFVGTAQYVSPELLTAKPLPDLSKDPAAVARTLPPPHAADFWAFGCVLYQFICGRTPFRAPNEYLIFQKITRLDYDFPPDFPDDARDLVSKLLVLDPLERLGSKRGVDEIKEHPFFSAIDFDTIWTVDPPQMETGMTAPTVFPKHMLALSESSIDDSISGEEGDAEESLFAGDEEEGEAPTTPNGMASPSVLAPLQIPPQQLEMLPPASPRSATAPRGDVPWPRAQAHANGKSPIGPAVDAPFTAGTVRGGNASFRSSRSSNRADSQRDGRPGTASTNGSNGAWGRNLSPTSAGGSGGGSAAMRTDSARSESKDSSEGGRPRGASTSKWLKFLTMPKSALQRVKAPATGRRKASTDTQAS